MTGGARHDDWERCLSVGLNDCLAKPVKLQDLLTVVARWAADPEGEGTDCPVEGCEPMSASRGGDDLLDMERIEELRELAEETGDPTFLLRLVDRYLEDAASRLAELREATGRRDSSALAAAAHALKGGSVTIGARKVAALSVDLEAAGRRGQLPGPEELARVSADLQVTAATLRAQGYKAP